MLDSTQMRRNPADKMHWDAYSWVAIVGHIGCNEVAYF